LTNIRGQDPIAGSARVCGTSSVKLNWGEGVLFRVKAPKHPELGDSCSQSDEGGVPATEERLGDNCKSKFEGQITRKYDFRGQGHLGWHPIQKEKNTHPR